MGIFDPTQIGAYTSWVIVLALWTVPWKGYALWKSARRGEQWWFIAMLILNTMAILEILYIFVFSKEKTKGAEGRSGEGAKAPTGDGAKK